MQMKGQISLELLVTLGIILSFTIPVVLLLFSVSQYGYETSSLLQADAAAMILSDSIDDVYSQGPGAKRTVIISAPTNTESIFINHNEVVIRVKTNQGNYDAVSFISARMPDTLIPFDGPFTATLTVVNTVNGPEVRFS